MVMASISSSAGCGRSDGQSPQPSSYIWWVANFCNYSVIVDTAMGLYKTIKHKNNSKTPTQNLGAQ
jgi:hypothetical protein